MREGAHRAVLHRLQLKDAEQTGDVGPALCAADVGAQPMEGDRWGRAVRNGCGEINERRRIFYIHIMRMRHNTTCAIYTCPHSTLRTYTKSPLILPHLKWEENSSASSTVAVGRWMSSCQCTMDKREGGPDEMNVASVLHIPSAKRLTPFLLRSHSATP